MPFNHRKTGALLFCFFASLLFGRVAPCSDTQLPAKEKFHIFLLMGQSNMAGSGRPVPQEYKKPHGRVLVLDAQGKWVPAVTPMDPKRKGWGGISPGQSFARAYADLYPDVTVGLVMLAKDGRRIEELMKGNKDRDGDAVYDNRMGNFLKVKDSGTIKAVLWHQGEANIKDPQYASKLAQMVADVRNDTGYPDLPWIVGELGQFASWTAPFNRALPSYIKPIAHTAMVRSDGLLDRGDGVHFNGKGVEVLGRRYLKAFLEMSDEKKAALVDVAAPEADPNLLRNPQMTEGSGAPEFWSKVSQWGAKVKTAKDVKNAHSEGGALCLMPVGESGKGCVGQTIAKLKGKVRVSGWYRYSQDGEGKALVALESFGSNGKPMKWLNVCAMNPTDQWVRFEKEIDIPGEPDSVLFLLMIDGKCKAWLDDLVLEKIEN